MGKIKVFLTSIIIALAAGGLSALLTRSSYTVYSQINLPVFAPPSWLFPVVWTILYILMGISAGIIWLSNSPMRNTAIKIYGVQLAVNFLWPIIFFGLEAYWLAFLWLVLLMILIIAMINSFGKINKTAAYLQIPYLIWVIFAGILNFAIALLN